MNKELDYLEALAVHFDSDAGENISVRGYLKQLLLTLWDEKEGFSGKRPFGNSGWDSDLFAPLIQHGFISGKVDEDGYIEDYDEQEANDFVEKLIHESFNTP